MVIKKARYGAFLRHMSVAAGCPPHYYNCDELPQWNLDYLRIYRVAATILVRRNPDGKLSIYYKSTEARKEQRADVILTGKSCNEEIWSDSPNNTFIVMAY